MVTIVAAAHAITLAAALQFAVSPCMQAGTAKYVCPCTSDTGNYTDNCKNTEREFGAVSLVEGNEGDSDPNTQNETRSDLAKTDQVSFSTFSGPKVSKGDIKITDREIGAGNLAYPRRNEGTFDHASDSRVLEGNEGDCERLAGECSGVLGLRGSLAGYAVERSNGTATVSRLYGKIIPTDTNRERGNTDGRGNESLVGTHDLRYGYGKPPGHAPRSSSGNGAYKTIQRFGHLQRTKLQSVRSTKVSASLGSATQERQNKDKTKNS